MTCAAMTPKHIRFFTSFKHFVGPLLSALFVVTLIPMMTIADRSNVASAQQPPANNPIVVENQQTGSNGWVLTMQGDDATGQIKGYASATSVSQNANITFYVSVNPAQTYTIDFYRFGWYAGLGARLRSHVGPVSGVQQPPCSSDPNTGLLECH